MPAPRKEVKLLTQAQKRIAELERQVERATAERDGAQQLYNDLARAFADHKSELAVVREARDYSQKECAGLKRTIQDLNEAIHNLERFNALQAGYIQRANEDEAVQQIGAVRCDNYAQRRIGPQQDGGITLRPYGASSDQPRW